MTYRHTTHLHGDYLDGELSPEQMEFVRHHLSICEKCRDDLDQLKRLNLVLKGTEIPDPGDDYFESVTDVILARTASISGQQSSPVMSGGRDNPGRQALKTLIKLAAAVTLLFTAFYVSDFHQQKQTTRWADKIKGSDYAAFDSLIPVERLGQPPVGIHTLLSMPSPADDTVRHVEMPDSEK